MENEKIAASLVAMARTLLAEENGETAKEEVEVEDEVFTQKIRDLRSALVKINRKKNMRLNKFGIGMIRPNAKVEELVDALLKIIAAA